MEKKYTYKGYSFPVKPDIAGKHLEELYEESMGELTPEIVVENAKKKNSPIHPCFEWNDKKAAKKHRLHQARMLMSSINIKVIKDDGRKIDVPKFVNIKVDRMGNLTHSNLHREHSSYMSIEKVMEVEELTEYVKEQAMREILRWKDKYAHVSEFSELCAKIEEIAA